MLKKNADKCDTDEVKTIDLTESEPPEEETNSEKEEEIIKLDETREEEKKRGCQEPKTEEKDCETEETNSEK